jgi:steroid delta-isomerase-like uncharacterized protein
MTRSEIEAMFARRQAAWDRSDAPALAADHAESCVVDSPLAGGLATGREAIERLYATYMAAFPDLRLEQEQLLIDGSCVALLGRVSGTDNGGFMGMSPTRRHVSVPIVFVYELEASQIVRERRIYDFTGVLVQIGLLKAKPA